MESTATERLLGGGEGGWQAGMDAGMDTGAQAGSEAGTDAGKRESPEAAARGRHDLLLLP